MTWRPRYKGDFLQSSRDRVSAGWKRSGWRYARGVAKFAAFGPGAAAVAGLANLFAKVPRLQGDPRVKPMPSRGIPLAGGKRKADQLLPAYRAPKAAGRSETDAGGYIQTKYSKDKCGKKLDKVQRMMKLLAAQQSFKIERFGGLTDTTSNDGFYDLNSFYDGVSPNRITRLPLYCVDLTGTAQKGFGTTVRWPAVMSRLTFNENGDRYTWVNMSGTHSSSRDALPKLTYTWDPIMGQIPVAATTPIPPDNTYQGFIGKVKIGMVITGARKFATTVWVQLVQFTDDTFGPELTGVADSQGVAIPAVPTSVETFDTDVQATALHKKFWTEQIGGLLENPLSKKALGRTPGMKILYSKRFNYNPTLTTESDAGGHESVFKLDYNMDKVINYTIQPDVNDIIDVDLADVNAMEVQSLDKSMYTNCHRKGRVYLLIKAAVPAVATSDPAATSYDNYPSFDLSVTRTTTRLRAESLTN